MLKTIGNTKVLSLPASQSLVISMKAADMQKQGRSVIKLSGGEPDFRTPQPIVDAAKKALDAGRTHYSLGIGNEDLRNRIARKMKEENGIPADFADIIITPGGKFALYMAMQVLLNPGDEVILVNPSWVSYEPMIMAAGGVVVPLELTADNNYTLTKEKLESCLTDKTKMILVCSPNNPTGHIMDEPEARILASFIKKSGIYCIADEIYERLAFGKKPFSLASIPEVADQVITMMGFSKGYAMTGWRLAWIAVPPSMKRWFSTFYSQSLSCTPTFIQDAAVHAFDCLDDIEMMRQSYMRRGRRFIDGLNAIEGVHAEYPEGAFYAWVSFEKNGMSMTEFSQYLLEKVGVAGVFGAAYGETADRHIRFSFAQAESDLDEAVLRIRKAMNEL